MNLLDCKLYWSKDGLSFCDTPFHPSKIRKLHCQHGPQYYKGKDHKTDRILVQSTRKLNCSAVVVIREYQVFKSFKILNEEKIELSQKGLRQLKECRSQELRKALQEKHVVEVDTVYHVSLPCNEAHCHHPVGEVTGMTQRMHPMLKQKIFQIVQEGLINPQEVRKVLHEYVKIEFKENCPDMSNCSYFPTVEDVRNHIYLAKQGLQYSKLDQENLELKIKEWSRSKNSKHSFRPFNNNAESEQTLLWVHQESWQQDLLAKYGNVITLMDATYKTTCYDVPLFFLCVRTNVGYQTVAEFVVQTETKEHILEAIEILK